MKVFMVHSMFISYDEPEATSLVDGRIFSKRESAEKDLHSMVEEFKKTRDDIQDIEEEDFYAVIYFKNNDYWEAQLQECNVVED